MSDEKKSCTGDEFCTGRTVCAEGWDGPGGHHTPVVLEKTEGQWHLSSPGWFTTPIDYCPWCGTELLTEKLDLGESVSSKGLISDAALDAIEKAFGGE